METVPEQEDEGTAVLTPAKFLVSYGQEADHSRSETA